MTFSAAQFSYRFPAFLAFLCAVAGILVGAQKAEAKEDTHLSNEVVLRVEVERAGQRYPLADIPSLEKDDQVYVQLVNARGYRDKFPFVANQRVASMKSDHGSMIIAAFINKQATAGIDKSLFPRATLAKDKNALVFKVPQNESTPFFFLIPALYDNGYDRVKEYDQFVKTVVESADLRAYLLRQVTAPAAGGLSRAMTADETDALLQRTQFLIPRVSAAIKLRQDASFKTRSQKDQTEGLYQALGLDLPNDPGALDYANNFLDAFASTDPTKPVKIPSEQQLGNLITTGIAILPSWYSTYLAGLNVFGKLSVILSGLNRRVRDERYFVAAQFIPRKDEKGAEIAGVYTLEPSESLSPNNPQKPGQRRKNVLVVNFGRTGLVRSIVRPTPGAVNATVYLDNDAPRRLLYLDAKSLVGPDQLERYCTKLELHVTDGGAPIPLVYEKSVNAFRLETDRDLTMKPTQAVLRGDWGHTGALVDVSEKFLLSGVKRAKWVVENAPSLTPGGTDPIRLRPEEAMIRPVRVLFRYKTGGEFEAAAIEESKQGYYAARFDLNGKRAGAGRIEIYKPGVEAPDYIDTFKDVTGADIPVQVFDPVRPVGPDDARYYAYDARLLLRRALFTDSTLPTRVTMENTAFERVGDTGGEWLTYETKQPRTAAGMVAVSMVLADQRTVAANVRVRPRRPAVTLADWRQRERVQIPFALPDKVVSQHAALLLTFKAQEGYRFSRNTRLVLGGAALPPDMEITDSAGAETVTFTLDPRAYPNLRGKITAQVREDREANENVQSEEFTLPFTLAQLPEGPMNLRFQNGRYRLYGQRLDVFAGAGTGGTLDAVQPIVTMQTAYIEFGGQPGKDIEFRLRQPDTLLRWTGPIAPAVPAAPTAEIAGDGKRVVKWGKAAGATGYAVYRSNTAEVPLAPNNRIAEVPESEAPAFEDAAPLAPGEVYFYRVVALNQREGGEAADFQAAGNVSAPVLMPPPVPLNIGAEYKTGEKPVVELRFAKVAGATAYRIYRGKAADFAVTPESKVGEVPATGDMLSWQDVFPLTPGEKYFYRVIAICVKEGVAKEAVSPPSAPSNPVGP
jgi:hypothetical protein